MNGAEDTLIGAIVLGATSCSLGVMLLAAQSWTRANVGIALAYLCIGPAIPLANHLGGTVGTGPELLARTEGLLEVGAMGAAALYVSGLAATSAAGPRTRRRVDRTVRSIYGVALVVGILGLFAPADRLNEFSFRVFTAGAASREGFWMFLPWWAIATVLFVYGYFLIAREQLDVGERARAVCALISSPLLIGALFVPRGVVLVLGTAAMVITFYGIYRYAVAQGERSAFLSRFLSPQVAEQARTQGLTAVMEPGDVVLTVVACDLRGFTAYAEAVPSQAVIDLLNDYYAAVGDAVAEVDGTVKDYAGDGILVLVGAPLPREDHAEAGLQLARRIHEVTEQVIARWSTGPHPLGIGVGVATGRATVGAIGSDARMEYTAVGTAVNLAARLCARAAAGETLVDEKTAGQASSSDVVPRDAVDVKGLSSAVPIFELLPAGRVGS